MAEKFQNVQDVFLNAIRKEKMSVTVFLVNGVKLPGWNGVGATPQGSEA